jgi:hypothetical protein
MGEVRDYTRNVMPLQVRDGVFSIGEEAEARASKIKSREATAKVWTREEQLSARSIFEVADVHVAPHLYELYFRDDLMGDGRFGKGDGSVMLLHPGCSSNNNNVLASRGGKRAQKKTNNPKSWGAEQTIMCGL